MTYEETARFLNGAMNYWPTLFRGNDPEAMTQAWAVALADIPYAACARGVVKLAQTLKFPPNMRSCKRVHARPGNAAGQAPCHHLP